MVIGGTVQAASEMIGIGSVGAGANKIISGISSGASEAIFGAGKGVGQILGGIESGINAAKISVDRGLRLGDVIGAVSNFGEGVRIAGVTAATGIQTTAIGTAGGMHSATGSLLSGLKDMFIGVLSLIITGPRSVSAHVFLNPVGRWVSFATFLLLLFVNGSILTTLHSTSALASAFFFNGHEEGDLATESTSLIFLFLYGPCTFLSSYGIESLGVRK
jgi:hypothetical protein